MEEKVGFCRRGNQSKSLKVSHTHLFVENTLLEGLRLFGLTRFQEPKPLPEQSDKTESAQTRRIHVFIFTLLDLPQSRRGPPQCPAET